jgi:hypothetical protein
VGITSALHLEDVGSIFDLQMSRQSAFTVIVLYHVRNLATRESLTVAGVVAPFSSI